MALDKFFCKVPETKVTDKQIEFHSEREANEYCRENDIDPHNVILMGDKYTIKTKDSNFRTTREDARCIMSKNLDKAIKLCDVSYEYEGTYRGAKIQITAPDNDGTRNVYLDGRAIYQDEGSVRKVLSAVQQLIDRQKR